MVHKSGQLTRRGLIAATASLGILPGSGLTKSAAVEGLWYRQPARRWEEALPIGNGRLGAMVFGRVAQERLQLNEDTLWSGGPYTPDNPDALAALPKVRALIADGQFKTATDLASQSVMARPLSQMAYGTLGDVFIAFKGATAPKSYERRLDLSEAIVSTVYDTKAGKVRREAFVSAPDQVIVLRMTGAKGQLAFDLGYGAPHSVAMSPRDYGGDATDGAPSGVPWLDSEPVQPLSEGMALVADGQAAILITGHNEADHGVTGKLRFAVRVQVICDGQVTVSATGLSVRKAGRVTLLISGATSFKSFNDVSGDPVAIVRQYTHAASTKSYAQLRRAHVVDYQALYSPMRLSLDGVDPVLARQPTDVRVKASETMDDPGLQALYFQYARYLMISSSRPGTQPANLQGIWNRSTTPPWGSKYTININTEMNYWPADPSGLGVCVEPLIKLVEDLAVTGAQTAKTMYGARGWVAHHNTDIWRAAAPIDGPMWGLWPCGGAWLCNTVWDHYDYSRNPSLPARLYPLMKGSSQFFLDTLISDPAGRGLVTSPSVSPENQHPFGSSLCAGPAMDRQIIRDLFDKTIACGQHVGADPLFMDEVKRARAALAPDRIGAQGQLQEWLEDWDDQAPEPQHRHVSHLYAVYPSAQINVRDAPALAQAAKQSLVRRGDLATGWGTAWRVCLWARLGDGNHAYSVLKGLIGPKRTYPNLFDAHPPFQIDGNFGGAAGILEMLVQSWGDEIHILPALPDAWPSGRVTGLKARGALSVDLEWARGAISTCLIRGHAGDRVFVRYRGTRHELVIGSNGMGSLSI